MKQIIGDYASGKVTINGRHYCTISGVNGNEFASMVKVLAALQNGGVVANEPSTAAAAPCLGCANEVFDLPNSENFVCKECSHFYTSKWVA